MHPVQRTLCLVVALGVGTACADGADRVGDVTVTDSAGVAIVTNGDASLAGAARWSLSGPLWEAGSDEGSGVTLFGVTDVAPLRGGQVAIANGSPTQVLVLGGDGALTATLGEKGEGPGEFSTIASVVALGGDSVGVWDPERQRLSVFTKDGAFQRDVDLSGTVPATVDGWTRMLPTASDALVAFTAANLGDVRGVYRLEAASHVMGPAGEGRGTLGPFPGMEMFAGEHVMGPLTFGARTVAATSGDRLVVGTGDATEVRIYDLKGALERVVRWPEGDRSVAGPFLTEYGEWVEHMIATAPEQARARLCAMAEGMPLAERLPAYGDLLRGDDGTFWVGAYPGQLATMGQARMHAHDWLVFDADGAVIATLRTPEGFKPYAVRDGRMWGVFQDELDVESVRAYDVERGDG